MKKTYFLIIAFLLSVTAHAANYAPASQNAFTGAANYCQSATASALTFTYNTCNGSVLASGVSCVARWYYNTTNSTTVGTATLVNTSAAFNCPTLTFGGVTTGSRTYTPVTTATGTFYYFCTITWTAASCNGTGGTVTSGTQLVTVNKAPTAATATANPTTLCQGATLTISGSTSGSVGTLSYAWTGPSYAGSSALNPAGFAAPVGGSGVYTLTVTTPGCANVVRTTSAVTVNPLPSSVTANSAPSPVCAGQTLTLSGTATGATSYSWSGPGYGGSTALNPPGFTSSLSHAGTFTLTATNACGNTTATRVVNVITTPPSAVVATATPLTVCTGSNLTLTGSATNAISYSWSGPAGSGYSSASQNPAAFATNSTHNGVFTLTATNGCGSTSNTTSTVSIGAMPAIVSTYTPMWMCSPSVFTEGWESGVPTAVGTPVDGWSTTATTASWYSQQTTGTFPTITNGHTGSFFCKFNSYSLSSIGEVYGALISPSFSMSGVSGASLTFWVYREVGGSYPGSGGYATEGFKIYINTSASVSGATQLGWVPRASDASPTSVTGTANPGTSGWYQYTVAIPGGFTGATNYILFSGVSAYGDDCYLDDIALTKSVTTTFTNPSTGGTWSSANTAIASVNSTSGVVSAIATGLTTISYTASGCASPATKTINVITATPAITAPGGQTLLCSGATLSLDGTYTGGSWSSSATAVASVNSSTGVVTGGATAGAVTITYAVGCGAAATYALTVVGTPAVITGTSFACEGSSTTLSSTTTGYTWSSSDPSTASVNSVTGRVTGILSGTATITYSTGCGTDRTKVYTVNAIPADISGVASICTLSTTPAFTDISTGVTTAWSNTPTTMGTINSSTGVFSSTATTGSTVITYTVNYISGSCATTVSLNVSNATPVAITPASPTVCTGASTTLADATPGGSWTVDPLSEDIATVSSGGVVTGLSQGTATISYNACGSVTRDVVVTGYSGAISNNGPLCTGSTLSLTSTVIPTPTYAWTGPASFSSALAAPTRSSVTTAHSGVYSLSVTTGGCARVFTTSVTVSPVSLTISPSSASYCTGTYATLTVTPTGVTASTLLTDGWETGLGVPTVPGTLVNGWNTTATTTTWYSQQTSDTHPTVTNGHTGTKFCMYNSYSISAGTASGVLVSPAFSLVGYASGTLSFWVYREVGGSYPGSTYYTEGFKVYVNTVANATGATQLGFVPRASLATPTGVTGTANPGTSGWYQYTVSIPGTYSGATNYILIGGVSAFGNDCYIDDISVTATAVPIWSPITRLFTNSGLSTPYTSGANVTTVYAAPTSSNTYTTNIGTCTSNSAVITVAAQPSISSVTPSSASICVGQTVSITAASAGGLGTSTYTWSGSAITTTTGSTGTSPAFSPTLTGSRTYSVSLSYTGTNCNTTSSSTNITVNTVPSVTLGAMPSICTGTTSPNVSYSAATGSPTTFSITYDAGALSAGFSNVSGAALSGGNIALSVPVAAPQAVYTGTVTVSNGFCTSTGYPLTITVYTVPTASITSAITPCMGNATSIEFTGTPGASIRYTVDAGSNIDVALNPTTGIYTLATGALTSSHTYLLVNANNTACTTVVNTPVTINPTPQQWVGGTPSHLNDWNTAANWTCGTVPVVTDDVTIASGYTYAPEIATSASGTTRNLIVKPGLSLVLNSGATLNVKGTLGNAGTISGAGTVVMNGSLAQAMDSTGSVDNLEIDNTSGVTIHSGSMVTIIKELTMTLGNLATGGNLALASSDTFASARIAPIASGSSISGNVNVYQYIQGGYRRFRFWSHPFNASMSLSQLQNSIDITGQGGSVNGFRTTGSNTPSAFRYDPTIANSSSSYDPGWRPYTNITPAADDSNKLKQYQGIRLFFRGAKGEGIGYWFTYTPSDTIIGMTGAVNQGTQTITLTKGIGSDQDYNMVGNPYPSPVDIGTVLHNALVSGDIVGSAFYVWNPSIGASGMFQAIPINTVSATPYYLPAYSAFQVRAATNGSTISVAETDKANSASNYLFKAPSDIVSLHVYDANYHLWDELSFRFSDDATEQEDRIFDAKKLLVSDFSFYSLSSDQKKLVIDSRPYDAEKVIPMGISSAYAQEYVIKAENVALPAGSKLYLHDKLLQKYVTLEAGSEYRFAITKDKNTQGESRFEISMKPAAVAPVVSGLHVTMTPNPATDDVQIKFTSGKEDNVSVRVLDMSGVSVYHEELGLLQSGAVSVPLSGFASGVYMVEITSGNQKVIQRLVKE